MGGPGAKVRTYRTSIPALSPMVLMDLAQLLWKVRRQTYSVPPTLFNHSCVPKWIGQIITTPGAVILMRVYQ